MSHAHVTRQSTDIVVKYIAEALGGDLFARFGLPLPPIVAPLPNELPQLEVRTQHTDLLFRLADDSVLHPEFQTTQRASDLTRFAAYNLAVFQQYERPSIPWFSTAPVSAPLPTHCAPAHSRLLYKISSWDKRTAMPCDGVCMRKRCAARSLQRLIVLT